MKSGPAINPVILAAFIGSGVFIFDLLMPLGVAGGVPYVALVLVGIWMMDIRAIYLLATIGTVLTIAGYFLSPEGGVHWVVLVNRGLAIFAIWITALILASRGRAKQASAEKEWELALRQQALNEHAIVSAADVKGNITYVNDKFCEISGYSRDELMGQNHRMLKSGEHLPEVYEDMWQTISNGRTWHGEIKNRTKDGGFYWVQATIVPFVNEKNRIYQYVSIRTDVTDRKLAEEAALAADRAKSDFLASMSHELRTPMNAILGFAQMLKYSPNEPLNETQAGYVDNILQGGNYLMELVTQVLELSRIEDGHITLNIKDTSPRDIIDGCIIIVSERAGKQNITVIDETIGQDLPTLSTDSTRLTQVLLNILLNAIKYNRENGSVTLHTQETPNGMLRIGVTDTGPGIPEDKQDDLFKPFERLGREARNIEGAGIGLTIAKQTIELLGGRIGFESVVDQGSIFWVDVPLAKEQVNFSEIAQNNGGSI